MIIIIVLVTKIYVCVNYHGGDDGNCNGNGVMVAFLMVMLKVYMVAILVMVMVMVMSTHPVDQPHHLLIHPEQFRLSSKPFSAPKSQQIYL